MNRIVAIDSHTEGEPTRVVVSGGPELGSGTLAERARRFGREFDWFRSAVVNEPRGSDVLVGALIVPPDETATHAVCGVIFFNNVGLLNACGHGTIGLAATLAHLGRIGNGRFLVQTPVGLVAVQRGGDGGGGGGEGGGSGAVSIENVPSYRDKVNVEVAFEFEGRTRHVRGDVAWGGNWFFLVSEHGEDLRLANVERLTAFSWAMRTALEAAGVRGRAREVGMGMAGAGGGGGDGAPIDHVELFGPASRPDCDSRNFVLCPGKAYDRSPCGTGTSAKMACLFADGKLREGQLWRQESIIGSRFVGSVRNGAVEGVVLPTISGSAFITAEVSLIVDPGDPFRHGIVAR
jgi:4-hydroxyproline epimerase